jgi:GcrA cell cycle regulator
MSCCWPQGDPKLPSFSFCGQPVAQPGLPYCVEQMRRAHPAAQRPVLHKSSRGPRVGCGLGELPCCLQWGAARPAYYQLG